MSYPEPPQYGNTPVALSPEAYPSYPRQPSLEYATSMGYEANGPVYAETPFMYHAKSSPGGMYGDDSSDMRVPSSNLSIASASSSNIGSPLSNHGALAPIPEWAAATHAHHGATPGIVDHQGDYHYPGSEYSFAPGSIHDGFNQTFDFVPAKGPGFVDPSLIHPDVRTMAMPGFDQSYPAPNSAYPGSPALSASPQLRSGNTSPFMHNSNYQPYSPFQPPPAEQQRRPSIASFSAYSGDQQYSGDEKEKQRCPHHDCGKVYKDLKAHMLTHQTERPEKCPIATCEYHVKGFARKYDKNRHTLTHYKGTMVCGFCPGSGSAAEKSFNRADVFKRHLTAVHGVEQTAPNSRKKGSSGASNSAKKLTGYAPDATGKCSTCTQTFNNAQDFYEHLDDCVLRIVQQEDPAEAINAQCLAEVENDRDVHATLEKNHLPTTTMTLRLDDDEMDEDMDDEDDEDVKRGLKSATSPSRRSKGNPPNGVQKSRGLTHSRGGVPLLTKSKGRKNRRDYPSSWGFDKGQMNMKKRVLAVFDGPRRLAKDDMMLSMEHEVRVKLADGKSYVTDLDIQTVKRAVGFHEATEEEKGPWVSDDPTDEQLKQMLAIDIEALAGKQ
ncbi:zinc finger protein PLAG1 [Podospora conica]|nr:zinc finger protein PLAG1 [Schizothecium conicum]